VDRLVGFAETTHAIPGNLIEAVHDAYVGDPEVRSFLLRENPAAAKVIAERFLSARRRGLWHPLRNSIDDDLAALIAEAETRQAAKSPSTPPLNGERRGNFSSASMGGAKSVGISEKPSEAAE
jgi:cobalamin biosynthesis Mg chelatase CobN